jgi:hypothetical protein
MIDAMRVGLAPVALFCLGVGCDFFVGSNDPWPLEAGTVDEAAETGSCSETNPMGECCPTANIGHVASSGATRFRIANLKFMGYRPKGTEVVDTSGPPVQISLCDYYNPTGKNGSYKIIHMSAASRWCGPCSHETSDVSGYDYQNNVRTAPGIAADTAPLGVLFMQALIDGTNAGTGATMDDLRVWMSSHESNFPSFIDPGPTQLREFSDGKSLPWNADIDARSMEILRISVGGGSDLAGEVKQWASWADANAPMP